MSNKTPKASGAKTVSARRAAIIVSVVVAVVAVAGVVWFTLIRPSGYATTQLKLDSRTIVLDVADAPDKQQLGLGQRKDLPRDKGMVFIYGQEAQRCFWMKDMNFSIDIIWLDTTKKVVHVEPDVSPATYPKTFCPEHPAQYIVELYPGTAKQADIQPGRQLSF